MPLAFHPSTFDLLPCSGEKAFEEPVAFNLQENI